MDDGEKSPIIVAKQSERCVVSFPTLIGGDPSRARVSCSHPGHSVCSGAPGRAHHSDCHGMVPGQHLGQARSSVLDGGHGNVESALQL